MAVPQLDERFFMHRLRATSLASLAGGLVAVALFLHHLWVRHVWSWDLLSVAITMAAVKQTLMIWYRFKD